MASGVGSGKAKPMQTPIRNTGFNSKKKHFGLDPDPFCTLSGKISYCVWGDPERRQRFRVKRAACCRAVPWAGRPGRPRGGGRGRWRPVGPVPPRPQTAAQRRLRPPPSAPPTVHLLARSPYCVHENFGNFRGVYMQCLGSVSIDSKSRSGSRILGGIPNRIRIRIRIHWLD